jgi:hypothetical protein
VHRDASRVEPLVAAALESDPSLELALRGLAEVQAEEKIHRLHDALIAPIAELLPPAGDGPAPRLVFVPHDALCRVPFGALMARDDGSLPLLAEYEVQVASSLQVLRLTLDNAKAKPLEDRDARALVVGYPDNALSAVRFTGNDAPVAAAPLPFALQEAAAVASALGTTALVGDQATKTVVLAQLAAADVVHLATHGSVDETTGKSELLLHSDADPSGGALLTEAELNPETLALSAQLVSLPACHSGRGQQWTGEGLVGLGRALLACGVPTVLLSLWSLPDQKGAAIMQRFYTLLADASVGGGAMQGDAAALLRQAILAEFQGGELRRRWMDWGGLQVLGAGKLSLPTPAPRPLELLQQLPWTGLTQAEQLQLCASIQAPATTQSIQVRDDGHRVVSSTNLATPWRLVPEPVVTFGQAKAALAGLSPAALYDSMRETRVLFSFGCARGGVNAAVALRSQLLHAPGWGDEAVYIDAINLQGKPGSTQQPDGTLRNDHWAEYYYMGTLLAHTVVVVLDPAWLASDYTRGELQLFARNAAHAHQLAARDEFPGSRFQLIVLYDTSAAEGTDEWARSTVAHWELPAAAAPTAYFPVRLAGRRLGAGDTVTVAETMADGPLAEFVELVRRRSNVEAAAGRCEEADRAGYAELYRRHWHAHALSQQAENKDAWWWTARGEAGQAPGFAYDHSSGGQRGANGRCEPDAGG